MSRRRRGGIVQTTPATQTNVVRLASGALVVLGAAATAGATATPDAAPLPAAVAAPAPPPVLDRERGHENRVVAVAPPPIPAGAAITLRTRQTTLRIGANGVETVTPGAAPAQKPEPGNHPREDARPPRPHDENTDRALCIRVACQEQMTLRIHVPAPPPSGPCAAPQITFDPSRERPATAAAAAATEKRNLS